MITFSDQYQYYTISGEQDGIQISGNVILEDNSIYQIQLSLLKENGLSYGNIFMNPKITGGISAINITDMKSFEDFEKCYNIYQKLYKEIKIKFNIN